jgi:hypothetical protein
MKRKKLTEDQRIAGNLKRLDELIAEYQAKGFSRKVASEAAYLRMTTERRRTVKP